MARKSDAHGSDWDPPVVGRGFDDDDGLDFADAPAPQGRKAKPSKSTAKSSARSTAQPSAGAAVQPAVGKSRTRLLAKPPASTTARSARTAADPAGRPRVGTAAPGTRRRGDELAHDDRPLLTVLVSGEGDEQFDVLVDGRAYWGGSTSPYRFEMRLDPGEHELRVRQRHAMDKQPGEFVPLILAVLLGDGRRGEQGPYFAALDARISISADSRLTVKYALTGRAGRANGRAAFKCTAGKGLECEVLDTSMSSTPRLRRRWRFANGVALLAVTLLALSIVGLGAYLCVLPGGSLGGGIVSMALGTLMAMGCALVASSVRIARDGGYAPDMDPPPQRRQPRKTKPRADGAADREAQYDAPLDQGADADTPEAGATEAGAARAKAVKSTRKPRRQSKPRRAAPGEGDYDGAYDDANEMAEFEEAGLSTADLTPEQLREAKRRLLKKLGGQEE